MWRNVDYFLHPTSQRNDSFEGVSGVCWWTVRDNSQGHLGVGRGAPRPPGTFWNQGAQPWLGTPLPSPPALGGGRKVRKRPQRFAGNPREGLARTGGGGRGQHRRPLPRQGRTRQHPRSQMGSTQGHSGAASKVMSPGLWFPCSVPRKAPPGHSHQVPAATEGPGRCPWAQRPRL